MLRFTLSSLLIVWTLNSFSAFWIWDSAAPHIYAGRLLARERQLDSATKEAAKAVKKEPSNSMAQCFLASILDQTGQTNEMKAHTSHGLQIDTANGFCQIQNAINVANQGDLQQAMTILQRLLDAEPENALAYDVRLTCEQALQQKDKAVTVAQEALAISPFDADLHYRLGLAAGGIGDFSTAVPQLAYALLLRPDRSEIAQKLRKAIEFAIKAPNAREQLANIASAPPDSPPLLEKLAWTFATNPDPALRNGQRAVQLANRACQLTDGKPAELLITLAAAYAEDAEFDKAIETAENALAVARANRNANTIEFTEKLIVSLQNQQPYREEPTP